MTILAELYATAWAVRPEVLTAVLGYVERKDVSPADLARACHFDPSVRDAAEAARSHRYAVHQQGSVLVDGSAALYRRGRTAILPVTGPIVRRGNLMSSVSGGPMTSVELLAKDLTRALEDESFDAVLLDIDSPGGEANGISELAGMIAEGRATKHIAAYVGDLAASAAYWLASAASEIVLHKSAAVGSIGVVMAVPDPSKRDQSYVEIVSSASPNKRPDPTTKDGKAQIQELVDALGDLFVDDVAAYRDVSREAVLADFGAGGLRVAEAAVDAGMADSLGSFEDTLARLNRSDDSEADRGRPRPLRPADPPRDDEAAARSRRPRREPSPAAASPSPATDGDAPPGGLRMSTLVDNIKLLIASADAPASADREAELLIDRMIDPITRPAASAGTQPRQAALAPVEADADATLRTRLVAAEAENARLRFAQIQARADAFVRARADELRVFPPEMAHLSALYCLLASDDETHGPISLGAGKTATRVTYLENLLASRQSRTELTADVFGDTVAHVLTERSRPKKGADEQASSEELAAYLQQTATGRQTLDRLAAGNGKGQL